MVSRYRPGASGWYESRQDVYGERRIAASFDHRHQPVKIAFARCKTGCILRSAARLDGDVFAPPLNFRPFVYGSLVQQILPVPKIVTYKEDGGACHAEG